MWQIIDKGCRKVPYGNRELERELGKWMRDREEEFLDLPDTKEKGIEENEKIKQFQKPMWIHAVVF